MYKITKESYGYQLVFGDLIRAEEMKAWVDESKTILADTPKEGFGVFVDMRTLKPLSPDVQAAMQEGQKLYKEKGMERSVVVVNSAILKMQFQRIAKETGIYEWERYIDASTQENWKSTGQNWLTQALDPDL